MSQIGHQHFKVVIKTNCLQHPSPSMVNDINLGVDYLKIDASLFQSKGSNEILNAKIYQIHVSHKIFENRFGTMLHKKTLFWE